MRWPIFTGKTLKLGGLNDFQKFFFASPEFYIKLFFIELAELASRIATVVENSKKDGSAVSALKDSLDSAQNIITALGKGEKF